MGIKDYTVTVSKLSDNMGGGYIARVLELPGCMIDGETPEEAMSLIYEQIEEWIEIQEELGRPVPKPVNYSIDAEFSGKFALRMPKSLHAKITDLAQKDNCSINSFINNCIAYYLGAKNNAQTTVNNYYIQNINKNEQEVETWIQGISNIGKKGSAGAPSKLLKGGVAYGN